MGSTYLTNVKGWIETVANIHDNVGSEILIKETMQNEFHLRQKKLRNRPGRMDLG